VSNAEPSPCTCEGLEITAPEEDASQSRAETFDILWEPNDGGDVTVLITGSCIEDFPDYEGKTTKDDGEFEVAANDITPYESEENANCDATIAISQTADKTTLSSDLKGTIEGRTVSNRTFTSVP
jgi:FtsP/CotA-like multicopper oxidase with cupredoxin domain